MLVSEGQSLAENTGQQILLYKTIKPDTAGYVVAMATSGKPPYLNKLMSKHLYMNNNYVIIVKT